MRRFSLGLRLAMFLSVASPIACGSDSTPSEVNATPTTAVIVSFGVANATTLTVGQNVQAVALLRNAGGDIPAQSIVWSVSDPTVATVSAGGLVTAVAPGTVAVNATTGGQTGSLTITVKAVPVAAVAVTFSAPAIVGRQITGTALTVDANNNALLGRAVSWGSSNSSIATVTPAGVISPISVGTTIISATSEGVSGAASLTVQASAVTAVTVTLAAPIVSLGVTTTANASVRDDANSVITNAPVIWSSSDVGVAAVSTAGVVTAFSPGTATISATFGGVVGGATMVVHPPVVAVSLSLATNPIAVSKTTIGTATVLDGGGNVLSGHTVVWSSSNASVATVTQAGVVTAVALGTATITATSEGRAGSVVLGVQGGVGSISVSTGTSAVRVGQTTLATATVRDATNNVLAGRTIAWSSTNGGVASVGSDGTVTGLGVGAANIVGTADGVSGSTAISVVAATTVVATQLGISTQPSSSTTAATMAPVVVQVRDANGAPITSAANVVTATVSVGGGVLSGTTSVAAVNGTATFSNLRITGTGQQNLLFTTPGLVPATSLSFLVSAPSGISGTAPITTGSGGDAEPQFSAGTGTLVFQDNMDSYTDATAMGVTPARGAANPPRLVPWPSPITTGDPVNPTVNQVITGRLGTGHALRMSFPGLVQTSASYMTYPENIGIVPDNLATHYLSYYARVNVIGALSAPLAVKWIEMWHISQATRMQFATHDHLPWTGGSHPTYWQIFDQTYSLSQGTQPIGPYLSGVNDNTWHRYSYQYRSNTPNAGTVSINHATLVATFSVSQAGLISTGSVVAIRGLSSPYTVSTFDGTTHATLTKVVPDGNAAPLSADVIAAQFSSILDGVARMWVDGVEVVNVSQAGAGLTPPGGEKPYCDQFDIASLAVNDGIFKLLWGSTQTTVSPPWTLDIDDLIWWTGR